MYIDVLRVPFLPSSQGRCALLRGAICINVWLCEFATLLAARRQQRVKQVKGMTKAVIVIQNVVRRRQARKKRRVWQREVSRAMEPSLVELDKVVAELEAKLTPSSTPPPPSSSVPYHTSSASSSSPLTAAAVSAATLNHGGEGGVCGGNLGGDSLTAQVWSRSLYLTLRLSLLTCLRVCLIFDDQLLLVDC